MPTEPSAEMCACGEAAIVGVNGRWCCLACFNKALANIGGLIKSLREEADGR